MITTHITIALLSIIFATYLLIHPSHTKQHINYILIASTVGTGTYLVITTHINVLQTCLSGLLYVSVVATISIFTQHKLAQTAPEKH